MARTKKQTSIPGTEGKSFKDVDQAAEAYVEVRDERMRLTESEVTAKDRLIEAMKKHNLAIYRDESATPVLIVEFSSKDKVKVRKQGDESADERD